MVDPTVRGIQFNIVYVAQSMCIVNMQLKLYTDSMRF